ncbi:MAG: histidine kinase [Flavobacteriaceae bacterium]
MKKVILLVIVLLGILIIPLVGTSYKDIFFMPTQKYLVKGDTAKVIEISKWEYVKTRLFPIGGDITPKFKGPILISLENASEKQRSLVKESIKEIQDLIPNKTISLYKDHTGYDHQFVIDSAANTTSNNKLFYLYTESISISFGDKPSSNTDYIEPSRGSYPKLNISVLSDSTVIKRNSTSFSPNEEIKGAILCFNFSKQSSYEKQKEYIKYELLKSLCYIAKEDSYSVNKNFFLRMNQIRFGFNRDNSVFGSSKYSPESYNITENDAFLLEKLYADDFQSQFKNYLTEHYPKLYVYNFYHKARVKIFSETLVILLGVFIFMMSLSILHKRRFRFGLFNYLLPILLFNLSIIALSNLINHLQLNVISFYRLWASVSYFLIATIIVTLLQSVFLWCMEYLLMKKLKSFVLRLILKVVLTFSSFVILYFFFNFKTRIYLENILLISLIVAISRGLYIYLNHYSDSLIKQKDVELSQLKELQAATELSSLHAQINPHFLYNSLNSIASLAHINADKTEKMALSLSDLFKYSINRKGEKMTTIKDAVEMVENYLKIEKIRFEDRLQFSINVDDELLEATIPRFILQPIIENAIKHGISKIEEKGIINLQIIKDNNHLIISISDNGPDFPNGLLSGHGLQSVYDLLRLSYGELVTINWENLPKKKITITISSKS